MHAHVFCVVHVLTHTHTHLHSLISSPSYIRIYTSCVHAHTHTYTDELEALQSDSRLIIPRSTRTAALSAARKMGISYPSRRPGGSAGASAGAGGDASAGATKRRALDDDDDDDAL